MGSDNGATESAGDEGDALPDVNSEPAMSLGIASKDKLQLTVTKSGLDVFNKLGAVCRSRGMFMWGFSVLLGCDQTFELRSERFSVRNILRGTEMCSEIFSRCIPGGWPCPALPCPALPCLAV